MAAIDLFNRVLEGLSDSERAALAAYVAATRENLLAARSEEASLREAEEFAYAVHDLSRAARR